MRAAGLALLATLAGCGNAPPGPPGPPESPPARLPPAEWLGPCPGTPRADRSIDALIEAWARNLESLVLCDDDKQRLREWRQREIEREAEDG